MEVPKKKGRRRGGHPATPGPMQIDLPLPATKSGPDRTAAPRPEKPPTVESDRGNWLAMVLAAITTLANTGEPFEAFDTVRKLGVPEPPDHHLWGAAFGAARAQGLIVSVAATQSSRPRTAKSLTRLWIGRKFAPDTHGAA